MRYLLDTHIIMWELAGDERQKTYVRNIIENCSNQVYFSAISPWEAEIKHNKHNDFSFTAKNIIQLCVANGLDPLPIKPEHTEELRKLKKAENIVHNDPFDRMLLAQAKAENMILITHDKKFEAYDEKCLMIV